MAKISCLILDEPYHGYYLHCRSPYPFADESMTEMTEQLKQEEAGLTTGRGLHGGPDDCQSYEIFLTRKWRRKFDKMYTSIAESSQFRNAIELGRLGSIHGRQSLNLKSKASIPSEKLVKASTKLNEFIKQFIENQDDDHHWKLYRAQTCISRFFSIPPEMGAGKQSLLQAGNECHVKHFYFIGNK